ncbi:hypothetical protein DN752_07410 [Echinicola strongylocentroti]|uniref:MAM domain-containing protein n=1 Tax=Echinicola strongylocentroti TaxID=1795355 RepID=A0A2Z4IG70_9BACT|nr:hypothetical protein [Echinicola strongylocentroti]AWW29964.1 hypothetical protein DN752_07410 [Echinicola strongylocentroti]
MYKVIYKVFFTLILMVLTSVSGMPRPDVNILNGKKGNTIGLVGRGSLNMFDGLSDRNREYSRELVSGELDGTLPSATLACDRCPSPGVIGGQGLCDDFDGDGVLNACDLDDDNDGILDKVECPAAFTNLVDGGGFVVDPATPNWYYSNSSSNYETSTGGYPFYYWSTQKNSTLTTGLFNELEGDNANSGTLNALMELNGLTDALVTRLNEELVPGVTYRFSYDAGLRGYGAVEDQDCTLQLYNADTDEVEAVLSSVPLQNLPSYGATPNYITISGSFTVPTEGNYYLLFMNAGHGGTENDYIIDRVAFARGSGLFPCDDDNDGIPNHLDLDSDGDGCPDAAEGGSDFSLSALEASSIDGGNEGDNYVGFAGPVTENLTTTEVDANGVPTVATSSGQTLGTSQNIGQVSEACNNCDALSGTITDSDGNPIEGIEVKIYADFDDNGEISDGDRVINSVPSNSLGAYSYDKSYYFTIQDDFSGNVFSGDDNSSGDYNAWLDADWSQSNSSNSGTPTGSNSDDNLPSQHIFMHNGTRIYRAVDLSKLSTAYLSFDFDTENNLDASDEFFVEISTDDGATYTTIYTYTDGDIDDQPIRSEDININEYAGASNVIVQFRTGTGDTEYVWIDNVTIYTEFPKLILQPRYSGAYKASNPNNILVDTKEAGACSMLDFELLDLCDLNPLDTDGDGLCDAIDIDDDNDGVLDETEGNFCGKLDRNIIIGYQDSGAGDNGLATDMLLNLNNFGKYGTYNRIINGVVLVPFSSSEITEANLLANNIDIFYAGSSATNSTASGYKLSTATNTTLLNWAETHDKGLFVLQNNAVDYGYTLTNNDVPPDSPNGELGENVYTYGYWPVSSISQTGTVKMTISSATRDFDVLMVDSENNPTVIKDTALKLVIFPDATIYNAESNTVDPNTNNATKVIANTWAFVMDTFIGDDCTEIDTDIDGIPNHLDLDSDGDSCPDAFEAGATGVNTPNFKFVSQAGTATDTNSDGLADVVDANLNSIPDYVSKYNPIALDNSTCSDSDGDGIVDSIDLDDDNDGILDADEGFVCVGPDQGDFKIGYINTTTGKIGLMENMLTNPDNFGPAGTYDKIPNVQMIPYEINEVTEETLLDDEIDVFYLGSSTDGDLLNDESNTSEKLPTSLNLIVKQWVEDHNKAVLVLQNNAIDFGYRIENNNDNPNTAYGPVGESVITNGYWDGNSFNQTGTVQLTASSATENYNVVMTDANGKATLLSSSTSNMVLLPDATIMKNNSSSATVSDDIQKVVANIHAYLFDLFLASAQCQGIDTDGDSVPNHLDLDSDGDGCPDINEAGVFGYFKTMGQLVQVIDGEVVNGNGIDDSENTTTTISNAMLDPTNGGDTVGPGNGFHDQLESESVGVYDNAPYMLEGYLDAEVSSCYVRRIYSNPAMRTGRKQ